MSVVGVCGWMRADASECGCAFGNGVKVDR